MKTAVSRAETVDFVAGLLRKNPNSAAAEVTKAAKAKGYHVYPLIFGLARKQLGIGPKAPSGRGPGRPRKNAAPVAAAKPAAAPKAIVARAAAPKAVKVAATGGSAFETHFNSVVAHIGNLEAEVAQLRGRLAQINSIAAS